jgi:phage FluMu protein Com
MEYKCHICNKNYSSYQSLWIHNKKYHKEIIKTINCTFCNKILSRNDSKKRHEKICKKNNLISDPLIKLSENNILPQIVNINNQINNNQINNYQINNNNIIINQLGKEPINSLTIQDIIKIVGSGNNCPVSCIKKLNFNKNFPENHLFCATTLEGKHFTKINYETQKPEKINKKDFIDQILLSSLNFIEKISIFIEYDKKFRII